MEGTLVIVNGSVESISLLVECTEQKGNREALRTTIDDISYADAKGLYLVLRSLLNVTGDLDELNECVL